MKKIFVIHEYGARSHYLALEALSKKFGYKVIYHELNNFSRIKKAIQNCSLKDFFHAIGNIFFLFFIQYMKPTKIVVGIAPYNNKIKRIIRKTRGHEVYYHTSYTIWNGSIYVHKPTNNEIQNIWKYFVSQYVKHIFAVSNKTKLELINNGYSTESKITVVNHSFSVVTEVEEKILKDLNFIYVGDLSERKGVKQLLTFFAKHPNLKLTIIGKGVLQDICVDYSNRHSNINYVGYVSDYNKLVNYYKANSFLVLNSQRVYPWEELFGMVIVEAMSCGCIPITTDHSGPKEIINNGINGFYYPEHSFFNGIEEVIEMNDDTYALMREQAILTGKSYHKEKIAERWKKIFEE